MFRTVSLSPPVMDHCMSTCMLEWSVKLVFNPIVILLGYVKMFGMTTNRRRRLWFWYKMVLGSLTTQFWEIFHIWLFLLIDWIIRVKFLPRKEITEPFSLLANYIQHPLSQNDNYQIFQVEKSSKASSQLCNAVSGARKRFFPLSLLQKSLKWLVSLTWFIC